MNCSHNGCKASTMKDDTFCYFHSQKPEVVAKREAARRRGGSRGKLPVTDDVKTVEDVLRVLSDTLKELRSSSSESIVGKSRAVGYLCGVILTALEKTDIEERICKLEELIADST